MSYQPALNSEFWILNTYKLLILNGECLLYFNEIKLAVFQIVFPVGQVYQ